MTAAPNSQPLTPLSFLARSAAVHPNREAIRDNTRSLTYAEFARHAQMFARGLRSEIEPGDRVAFFSPNSPELLIAHFSVPLAGGVLVPINTRLQAAEVAYILEHSSSRVFIVDAELQHVAMRAVALLADPPTVLAVGDHWAGATAYEDVLQLGANLPELPWTISDENAMIAINYTSGTTGNPKGVMYSHRGAALNSLGFVQQIGFNESTRYLWTLPMFHCNGWCTTWAVTAAGGLHLTLRAVREDSVWQAIDNDGVTHLCGAPTVLSILAAATQSHVLSQPLSIVTGGAPPSPSIIERIESLGATLTHGYGLTEVYGPFTMCTYQPEWGELSAEQRARRMARQGVPMIQSGALRVVDEEMNDVRPDGESVGEIVMRGNNVMLGYYRDDAATEAAFRGGWFHSGDLGVLHPDGYLELRDREKDIIISGGENISSIEVENTLLGHPSIEDAGVVAVAHAHWGERPVAFIVCKQPAPTDEALRDYVASQIARFKAPDHFVRVDGLPRTSTGKILKNELRARAAALTTDGSATST